MYLWVRGPVEGLDAMTDPVDRRVGPRAGDLVRIWYEGRWHTGRLTEYDGYLQTGCVVFPNDYKYIPAYPDGTRGMVRNFGEMRPAIGDFYLPEIPEGHRG